MRISGFPGGMRISGGGGSCGGCIGYYGCSGYDSGNRRQSDFFARRCFSWVGTERDLQHSPSHSPANYLSTDNGNQLHNQDYGPHYESPVLFLLDGELT